MSKSTLLEALFAAVMIGGAYALHRPGPAFVGLLIYCVTVGARIGRRRRVR